MIYIGVKQIVENLIALMFEKCYKTDIGNEIKVIFLPYIVIKIKISSKCYLPHFLSVNLKEI